MEHHFNCEIAQKYGIAEAIILNHFEYWIAKNKANECNFFEGDYWTYNSVRAFKEIFPYLTEKKISFALSKLKNEGIIKTGNFNENKHDRTLWYAITEKGFSILQNGGMEKPKKENRNSQNVEPIPNNNTNKIPNNINKEINKEKKADELFEKLWKEYPNKKGKADVHKTNKLELLKFGYEKLSRAIKNYDKSVSDKKFLMHGSRFFKTGFLDYLEVKEEMCYSNIRRL